jgi:deazaflavin-dependent oxidoreductase (nitroreductase family)
MSKPQRLRMASDHSPYLYLTTRGRKSGQPREIEIWFTEYEGRFYVIAEYETANWLQNIRACGDVQVRVAGRNFPARARVLWPETDAALIRTIHELSRQKHGWGEGAVVELEAK